jgi:hypothetical protein
VLAQQLQDPNSFVYQNFFQPLLHWQLWQAKTKRKGFELPTLRTVCTIIVRVSHGARANLDCY